MRQAETAAAVYRQDIQPTINQRQMFIRQELADFIAAKHFAPTALELLHFMFQRYPNQYFDPNSVRPRLHELENIGSIRHGVKRRCDVTGKTVLTWVLCRPEQPQQDGLF
jgi:hypothetical protein